jgi:type II secretory pathway pseudopilin PulG
VSTGLIVAIVVVALIILALLVLLPRMRATAQRKKAERELGDRRRAVAEEHRSAAAEREQRAEVAEQKARIAQQSAERERAEAGLQNERATMHERGMADDELIDDHERDRFEGVANTGGTADADGDGHTMDDRARNALGRDRDRDGVDDRDESAGSTSSDYEQGRRDERTRITDDVRDSNR